MRKQTWVVNVLLLALAAGLGVRLRGDWIRGAQRQQGLYGPAKSTGLPAGAFPGAVVPPVASTESIVQNNVFSPDRNNLVPQVIQRQPPPPDPVLLGSMDLGTPVALMTEGGPQPGPVRQVKQGEEIGGYKVVKISGDFVTVSYEGQEKRIQVLTAPRQVGAPSQAYVEPARPVSSVTTANPASKNPPREDSGINKSWKGDTLTSGDMFGNGVPDTYPAGTVINGYRKMEHPWPFGGKQVWWEKVQ
jgi:hypothetical protein